MMVRRGDVDRNWGSYHQITLNGEPPVGRRALNRVVIVYVFDLLVFLFCFPLV